MNALQVNFAVRDVAAAIRFYSAMFACPPAMLKSDRAVWVLREPAVRFTIFAAGAPRGETTPERGWLPTRENREPQPRSLGRALPHVQNKNGKNIVSALS